MLTSKTSLHRMTATLAVTLAAGAACAALPSGAAAYGGTAWVDTDGYLSFVDDDEGNRIHLDYYGTDKVILTGYGITNGPGCNPYNVGYDHGVSCPIGNGVELDLRGGDDSVIIDRAVTGEYAIDFGAGDDYLDPKAGAVLAYGGEGADYLKGGTSGDELHGGPGADHLDGGYGADDIFGDDGDDVIIGDGRLSKKSADVIDGGAGRDELGDYLVTGKYDSNPGPVSVTYDGLANDGFPGEGDDVRGIEELGFYAPGTYVGGASDDVISWETSNDLLYDGPSTLRGLGGNDELVGSPLADVLEGGDGNDLLTGAAGSDTLDAGAGDDTVDARDGVADTVTCGPGSDKVAADAVDTVAADCETVTRPAASTPPGGGGVAPGGPAKTTPGVAGGQTGGGSGPAAVNVPGAGTSAPKLALAGKSKLSAALRSGLTVRVPAAAGAAVEVRATSAGKLVASGSGTASAAGVATVKVRFTAKAKKRLRSKRSVTLVVRAGTASLTVKLAR